MTAGARRRTAPTFDDALVETRPRKAPAGRQGAAALPVRADERALPVPVPAGPRERSALRRNVTGALGLALIAGVAALAAALATWSIDDPSWSHITDGRVRNVLGSGGAVVADLVMQLIGLTAALFLAPVVIWGWQLMVGRMPRIAKGRWLAWLAGTFVGAAFMGALPPTAGWPLPTGLGGAIGDLVLQIPAAFTGGVLSDTGRLACLILFGPAAAALMIYAAGFPAGAPDDDAEESFEEDEAGGTGSARSPARSITTGTPPASLSPAASASAADRNSPIPARRSTTRTTTDPARPSLSRAAAAASSAGRGPWWNPTTASIRRRARARTTARSQRWSHPARRRLPPAIPSRSSRASLPMPTNRPSTTSPPTSTRTTTDR